MVHGSHGSVSPRDDVERRSHLPLLHVLVGLVVQHLVGGVRAQAVGGGEGPLLLPHGHGQVGQADADVFKGVEQEDADDDGEEAAERADHVVWAHVAPLLEEDGGAREHWRGEEHVVDGSDQGGVEDVQSFVQVVDLCADAGHQPQDQDPRQRVPRHVLPRDRFLDGDAQTFDARHRQRADHRADGDVDQDVGLAVAGTHHKDEDEGHDDDNGGKQTKAWKRQVGVSISWRWMTSAFWSPPIGTWIHQLLRHVFQAGDLLLLRGVDHHGGGAQDTEQAAELPMQV